MNVTPIIQNVISNPASTSHGEEMVQTNTKSTDQQLLEQYGQNAERVSSLDFRKEQLIKVCLLRLQNIYNCSDCNYQS